MLVHQTIGGVLFPKLLQDVLISDLGEVDGNFHRLERGDGGRAEVLQAVGLASGLLDRASGYVDSFGDCFKGIRILAWIKDTSVAYCPTGLKTTF